MNEIGRKIADKLIEIHGSTDFKIAFLPYKRSMWDSMESVFEECRRSGAAAYCVPIPYYRIIDGKIAGVDSDKDMYEKACSVSFLEQNIFDFVVIHYPYDGNNKVTRMCSAFYTAELRKYGKVVYIPYSCTNMRQLWVQPGIANVDYAFLSSEDAAEYFIEEWEALGVDFSGRAFGYGSPKMDAISKIDIPHNERQITLVLNSLAAFLRSPFERIRLYQHHISNEIRKGHDVIFRPHPLLRQTIKSMRPDTEETYEKFISWCWTQDRVIVDGSEYLEAALAQADYLISDPSSVLEMWMSTGREFKII